MSHFYYAVGFTRFDGHCFTSGFAHLCSEKDVLTADEALRQALAKHGMSGGTLVSFSTISARQYEHFAAEELERARKREECLRRQAVDLERQGSLSCILQ